ncbi:hypothetical protein H2201_003483 [Coniosporium apollinis]|uniref:Uncharacterized protein n=2 Tax=Coniosporium TaxID=2810619 RepID=A0ABQ9NY93_9PEZI|nr:hypothetical protein H2199_007998 [Cladosporium sp. JES 115]KAJ9666295.1 hypothetical protein H2201_003483 [Coniosporium apollinis]
MAVVRDPAFWRRFSMAVHMDEEAQTQSASSPTRPNLKHSDSWLSRQEKKRSRRTCICWIFWLCFFSFVAGLVIVILWLKTSGVLDNIKVGQQDAAKGD